MEQPENSEHVRRGARAEEVAEWFFRLNGFFLIPGFIAYFTTNVTGISR
jgi:hypothetical protein